MDTHGMIIQNISQTLISDTSPMNDMNLYDDIHSSSKWHYHKCAEPESHQTAFCFLSS